MHRIIALSAIALSFFWINAAEARPHHHRHHRAAPIVAPTSCFIFCVEGFPVTRPGKGLQVIANGAAYVAGVGARPSRWCGWFMQKDTGVTSRATGRNLNMAREWAHVGRDAGGPQVGAIVVWRHHVGKIVGGGPGAWVVRSGNDGRAVRERVRSVAGAIAFRHV